MLLDKELEEVRSKAWSAYYSDSYSTYRAAYRSAYQSTSKSASQSTCRSASWAASCSKSERKKQVEMVKEIFTEELIKLQGGDKVNDKLCREEKQRGDYGI